MILLGLSGSRVTPGSQYIRPLDQLGGVTRIDVEDREILFRATSRTRSLISLLASSSAKGITVIGMSNVGMILSQASEQFMKVFREIHSEILTPRSVVQAVANEDVIQPGQSCRVAIVAARIEQSTDVLSAKAGIDHVARRQIAFAASSCSRTFSKCGPWGFSRRGTLPSVVLSPSNRIWCFPSCSAFAQGGGTRHRERHSESKNESQSVLHRTVPVSR